MYGSIIGVDGTPPIERRIPIPLLGFPVAYVGSPAASPSVSDAGYTVRISTGA